MAHTIKCDRNLDCQSKICIDDTLETTTSIHMTDERIYRSCILYVYLKSELTATCSL